ncbi:MAG: gamma-butyrobetaine hydroxylase-like domain-containing protein [Psychrobium sp.]
MFTITHVKQHCFSYLLEVHFSDGYRQLIGFELLRVYSPNATKIPNGLNQPPLVTAKAYVKIFKSQHDGNKLDILFDDSHQSGSYSAGYLRRLCEEQDELWRDYLARLKYAKQLKDNAISLAITE